MRAKCVKFYENWFVMAESRDTDEKRLAFYDAIMRYAFRGDIPTEPKRGVSKGPDWAAWDGFNASRPVIDGAIDRENKEFAGRIGGYAGNGKTKPRTRESDIAPQIADEIADEIADPNSKDDSTPLLNINIKDKKNNNILPEGSIVDPLVFENFWKSYPPVRRFDKTKCKTKFNGIVKKSKDPIATIKAIMDGLAYWKDSDIWKANGGQFVCAPLVWLNNERWNDRPANGKASQVVNVHQMDGGNAGDAF